MTDNHVFPRVRPAYLSPNPSTLESESNFDLLWLQKNAGNPPAELVIVSKSNMARPWSQSRLVYSKLGNVYLHCLSTSVQQQQPYFRSSLCVIPSQITRHRWMNGFLLVLFRGFLLCFLPLPAGMPWVIAYI